MDLDEQRTGCVDPAASPRLFRNPGLDKLSRVPPFVPFLIYLPIMAVLLWRTFWSMTAVSMIAALAFGYLLWTLVEYFGHRFLFHLHPNTPAARQIQFLIHGVHHKHPNDPLRLVMPPIMSLPIMVVALGVLRLVVGARVAPPALAGFLIGYLMYDALHFYVHHAMPENAVGRYLRYRHMHHHFRDDSSWFGVSAPWWDGIFGTRPAQRSEPF